MNGLKVGVTGALGALGSVLVDTAVSRGAGVAAIDAAPAGESRATVTILGADLTDPAATRNALSRAAEALGGLDVLVNVAGGFRWETVEAGALDTWTLMYRLNVATAVNACQAALPHLLASGRGAIVNIGAGAALKSGAGMGAYAASKSGVHRLTESLAEELKGRVTVNAVLPSIIDTAANRREMPDADFSKWVSPAQLSDVILYLAGQRAITGALLPVTGGV